MTLRSEGRSRSQPALSSWSNYTLVIPKKEVDYIFNLDNETYSGLMQFARRVAAAVEKACPCKRVGLAVIGLEVPHTHIHLIPINKESDMLFSNPKQKLTNEEFIEIAQAIAAKFE